MPPAGYCFVCCRSTPGRCAALWPQALKERSRSLGWTIAVQDYERKRSLGLVTMDQMMRRLQAADGPAVGARQTACVLRSGVAEALARPARRRGKALES